MLDLIIRGGQVVTPDRVGVLDVAVQGEKIAYVAEPGAVEAEAQRTIDASGKIVIPGGVEPHTHIANPVPQQWAKRPDYETQSPEDASRAAAFGGTTTFVDFATSRPNILPMEAIESRVNRFAGHSHVDFTFHCTMTDKVPFEALDQIKEAIDYGVVSFKIFTTFGPARRQPPNMIDDGHIWAVMTEVASQGGIMAVHAEDDEIVEYMIKKLNQEGKSAAKYMHLVHSNLSEDISFRKITRLAHHTGVGVYFVHVTAKEGVQAIAEARGQSQPVYGEALHHYLCFTGEEHYATERGPTYHTYPALKFPEDRDALWQGIIDGTVSTTATDEYTTSLEVKMAGQTIEDVCGGHNGIETRIPVLFSEGVSKGRISLQRFVEVTSSNAAKILGMYPQKGAIAPGSDADIVLIDPGVHKKLALSDLHAASDYSIWEGWEFQGYPVLTILRGKVIVENGNFNASPSDGRFVKRKISEDVRNRPAC